MTDPQTSRSEAVVGPFTLRETVIGGSILVMFIGSVLPFFEAMGRFGNLWNSSSLFFLAIGIVLPIATAGLLTARRLGTDTRIGSLSVDQFASVVAVLATAFFFLQTVTAFHYGPFICLLGAIGMLVATVGGPHLPLFSSDFAGRPAADARVTARPILPAKPKAPKAPKTPNVQEQEPQSGSAEEVTQWSGQPGTTTAAGAAVPAAAAGATTATAGTAGAVAEPQVPDARPAPQKKSATGAGRGRFGFGAARGSSPNPAHGTPDAHRDSSVAPVPGVQDKELPDNDSSAYPRFADEDFAPYAKSADSAKSPDSAESGDSTQSRDSAQSGTPAQAESPKPDDSANSAKSHDSARASSGSTDRTQAQDSGTAVEGTHNSPNPDSSREDQPDTGRTGQQNAGADSGTQATDQASVSTGQQDAVPARTAAAGAGVSAAAVTTAQPVVEHRGSGAQESISATKSEDDGPVVEAFWFAVGTPRPVVDEASGVELFVLRPGDWEVGIEDRGEEFLVQDKRTGRVGVMRDLTNIERAPSDS